MPFHGYTSLLPRKAKSLGDFLALWNLTRNFASGISKKLWPKKNP